MNKITESRKRAVRRLGIFLAAFSALLSVSGVALAADPDPTGGIFTTAQSSLTTVIIPAAAALIVVGIVFAVAVKWMGKAMKKG